MRMEATAKIEQSNEAVAEFGVVTVGRVVVCVHKSGSSKPMVAAIRKACEAAVKAHETAGSLLVLLDGARPPEGDGREQAKAFYKDFAGKVTAHAVALEGTGFWAAAMRSVLTFLIMATGGRSTTKVFSSAAEAVTWMAKEMPGADARELAAAIDKLRKG